MTVNRLIEWNADNTDNADFHGEEQIPSVVVCVVSVVCVQIKSLEHGQNTDNTE